MVRKASRPHRAAVVRMLRATGLAHMPEEAPLVELLRMLADELDEGGSSRARAEYLSALKDVRRVLNGTAARPKSSADPAPPEPVEPTAEVEAAPVQNDLANFKAARGIA